ncbi:hypothetical protein TIFTF001_023919 [Ficus carica]|uniref:Uncharacterized protein n=1 Tax=Ficus carica TaxID=3494 RepID=A0AA88DCX1_FICCA|nr:hypothetical protein TIFTF001_023919 [Ficus carica]
MTKNKAGRPKKIPSMAIDFLSQQEKPTIVKRGRGRPRKYPPNPNPQAKENTKDSNFPSKLGQVPDLVKWLNGPGMGTVWGEAKKGKRVNRTGGECRKENGEDSGFPSAEQLSNSSSTESNSDSKADNSWLSGFVIPGPIPDLDELLRNQSVFEINDFFSGIPDDWDLLPVD